MIGGSAEVPGAAILAGTAALRAGAGKLQIATDASVTAAIGVAVPEARVIAGSPLPHVAEAQSVIFGCGMDHGPDLDRLLAELLGCGADVPLVLDAAVLGCLPAVDGETRAWRGGVTLLPHAREMARLLECEAEEVEIDPLAAALRAAGATMQSPWSRGATASSPRRTAAPSASKAAASGLPPRARATCLPGSSAASPRAGPMRSPRLCGASGCTAKRAGS